jgi:hypothetical protein
VPLIMFLDAEREDLLDDLMSALNALAEAGCPVTIGNGRLDSRAGCVIRSSTGRWASRPLITVPTPRPLLPGHLDSSSQP